MFQQYENQILLLVLNIFDIVCAAAKLINYKIHNKYKLIFKAELVCEDAFLSFFSTYA